MVAKMLLLAAAVSAYVATASAVPTPPVYAEADQVTRAYPDENYAESTTEAESEGALNEAYADAEGFAGYTEGETLFPPISYTGNFAAAKTVAESTGVDSDTESNANSLAQSGFATVDGGAAAAEALAESESLTSGYGVGDADSIASADARGAAFAGAETLAEALAADDAGAYANSQALGNGGSSFTDAGAVAYGGDDATSRAVSISISAAGDAEDSAVANADAYTEAGRLFDIGYAGGDAVATAVADAFNDNDAQATAASKSITFLDSFGNAGTATNRATSRAGGRETILGP